MWLNGVITSHARGMCGLMVSITSHAGGMCGLMVSLPHMQGVCVV